MLFSLFTTFISVLGTGLPDDVYLEVPFSEMDTTGEDSVNPYPETEHMVRYKHTNKQTHTHTHLLLLLLLYDMDVSCHRPFLPGTSLEPAVIPTAQASSFTPQYFP